jgi:hypothetical protein
MKAVSLGEIREATEDVMRSMVVIGMAALAVGMFVQPAAAKKSKMGCEVGREVWNAAEGKCMAGKYTRKAKKAKKDSE